MRFRPAILIRLVLAPFLVGPYLLRQIILSGPKKGGCTLIRDYYISLIKATATNDIALMIVQF